MQNCIFSRMSENIAFKNKVDFIHQRIKNLTFIKANYRHLPKYIITLKTSGLSLAEVINIIAQIQNEIGANNSSIGKSIKKKKN